ncbi:MAG: hypothetical protein K8R13_04310 [Methanococcoides sp.]|nr:hypothetical protein [Methanococcoides sp.]
MLFLALVTAVITDENKELIKYDVPNYPNQGIDITPTNTYIYIDTSYGNYLIYDIDYVIKYSKRYPPDTYDISLYVPTEVMGFNSINAENSAEVVSFVDSKNRSLDITNEYRLNPFLLNIIYTSGIEINPELLVTIIPLPSLNNNSIEKDAFYVNVKNTRAIDIKQLRLHSNLTKLIDIYLVQLENESWVNQPILISENGVPVGEKMVDDAGIITWTVTSLDSNEQKTYYFKKMNEYTYKK